MKLDWMNIVIGAVGGVVLYSLYSTYMGSAAAATAPGGTMPGGYGPGGGYIPPGGGGYGTQAYSTTGAPTGYGPNF